jgi:predicted dehydrogenase
MQALMKHKEAKIVGVADAYKGRIDRAIERTGAKAYNNYTDILADKSIDAVLVVTPDHWHKQMIIEALRAGKDVYSEKPLTYTSAEGREIIAAANETKRILQVGSQGVSCPRRVQPQHRIRRMDLSHPARRIAQDRRLGHVPWTRAQAALQPRTLLPLALL